MERSDGAWGFRAMKTGAHVLDEAEDLARLRRRGIERGGRGWGVGAGSCTEEDTGEAEEGGAQSSCSTVAGMGTRRWSSGAVVAARAVSGCSVVGLVKVEAGRGRRGAGGSGGDPEVGE